MKNLSARNDNFDIPRMDDIKSENQTLNYTIAANLAKLVVGEKLGVAFGKIAKAVDELITHLSDGVKHITAAERTAWNGKAAGNHTHSNMTGASASAAGKAGFVPAPAAGLTRRDFLSAAGTWRSPFRDGDEPPGQNLNDCTKGGVYFFVGNAMPENAPESGAGWLMTLENSSNYVKQLWLRLNSSVIYVRTCSNGTWSDWHKLATLPSDEASKSKYLRGDGTWQTPPDTNTIYLPADEAPKAAGTAAAGSSEKYAREDHVHPLQTSVSGNAGTASQVYSNRIANWLTGNQGIGAAVNMTGEGNSYKCLAKLNSNNGVFTQGVLNDAYSLNYTTNDTIAEGKNTVNYQIRLLNESGNSIFPGNIKASSINLRNSITDRTVLSLYDDGDDVNNGGNLLVQGGGNTYIGSGESSNALYNAHTADTLVQGEQFSKTGERLYLASDLSIMFEVNCGIVANRKVNIMDVSGNFYPGVDNGSNLGLSAKRWNNAYITTVHGNLDGNASTATKLGTANVGSAAQPIYLNGGTPAACAYTLKKSVPADAKFTDTTYSEATQSAAGLMSADDKKKLDSGYVVKSDDDGLYVEI